MAADDASLGDERNRDKVRYRFAWAITAMWLLCFPAAAIFKDFPITWAQPPMMAVVSWLFAGPLLRRNGNGDDGGKG